MTFVDIWIFENLIERIWPGADTSATDINEVILL